MTKKTPPHLPPKTCSIPLHRKLLSLRGFLFLVGLSFLAGISAALVTIAWVAPSYVSNTPIYSIEVHPGQDQSKNLDPLFRRQVSKQLVNIYDARKKTSTNFYDENALISTAVFFTSDGWLATYYPGYFRGAENNWEIIDSRGLAYSVEEVVRDNISELLYIKISGDGFPVINFPSWKEIKTGEFLWAVRDDSWQGTVLEETTALNNEKQLKISLPQYRYLLSFSVPPGSVLLTESGLPAGFVDNEGRMISAFFLEKQYPNILKDGKVLYEGTNWQGFFVNKNLQDDIWQQLSGFYITKSLTGSTSSTIGVGDVVLEIDNEPIDEIRFSEQILLAPREFPVSVLRQGQKIDIIIEKEKLIL